MSKLDMVLRIINGFTAGSLTGMTVRILTRHEEISKGLVILFILFCFVFIASTVLLLKRRRKSG